MEGGRMEKRILDKIDKKEAIQIINYLSSKYKLKLGDLG